MSGPVPEVRAATRADMPALAALLGAVVRRGGTTAIETAPGPDALAARTIDGPGHVSCILAEDGTGPLGLQWLARKADWPADWAAIATFARIGGARRGIGRALMASTLDAARLAGIAWIDATIRADNASGLAFYERMGFETYRIERAVPLADGTPVDRISKRRGV